MVVMPDLEDPFAALGADGLFVDPYASRNPIDALLTQLPKLFAEVKHAEPALLGALNAALEALAPTVSPFSHHS